MSLMRSATYKGVNLRLHSCGDRTYYLTKKEGALKQELKMMCNSRSQAIELFRMHVLALL